AVTSAVVHSRGVNLWSSLAYPSSVVETGRMWWLVPNPMSYYIHQSPWWFHLFEVLSNHFVELVILLFTFLGRCMVNGTLQIVFQVTLIVSGNLSFLNWLTIVPSMLIRWVVNVALGVLIGYLSIPVVLNLLSSRQVMNTSFSPLRIERTEVILQGTLSTDQKDPEAVWEDYQFLWKPGDLI
uniref:Lipase maturation factor n=1 Tax=Oncorhynchus tshawytscha TaxID=74940 RepID=A0A8C8F038_ONCTS